MAKGTTRTRRSFLAAFLAVPGLAAACGASRSDATGGPDATGPDSDGDAPPPDGSPGDGSPPEAAEAGTDASLPEHVCAPSYPRIDLKADCGAVGDGHTNDNAALQKAAAILQQAGGGELTIPPGVYVVGGQTTKSVPTDPGPYYRTAAMFEVHGLACLKVSGYGATLRVADGLHYGGFDPTTGQPMDALAKDSLADVAHAAAVGRVLAITSCDDVLVEGLEIDGNNQALVLGGQWGDTGIQAAATGVWLDKSQNVTISDVHTHHHGLDGVAVEYSQGAPPQKMPHTLLRVVSEYNGRQGLSWIGGWGLYCTDCEFNHTGRAVNAGTGKPLQTKPGDGVDIEPNAGTTQRSTESVFTRCEFIDNWGNGVEAANGNSDHHTFDTCTFWGTTNYSMWVIKPQMTFTNCQIHGTLTRGEGTMRFEGCTFEDIPWSDGQVYRNGALCALPGYDGMTWSACTFVNHGCAAVIVGDPTTTELFQGCTFVHSNAALSDGAAQSQLSGSQIRSCHFEESAQVSAGTRRYTIAVTKVVVVAPASGDAATHVDGPRVTWGPAPGLTGDIAPGSYG